MDAKVIADLKQSVLDEKLAAKAYHQRGDYAKRKGDLPTASLYYHIEKEELVHAREYLARLKKVLGR